MKARLRQGLRSRNGLSLNVITRSILNLFTGSLYLPSPTSCFQDIAGTTPCAVDTTEALKLDEMRMLGSELVTNGSFTTDTDWTKGAGWTISVGVASITSSASANAITQAIATSGKTYIVEFDIVSVSANGFAVYAGGTATTIYTTAGHYTEIVQQGTANTAIGVKASVTGTTGSIDNISVKEVTGIHATQATAGFRPPLRGKVKNLLTWSEDLTNAVWVATGATKSGQTLLTPNANDRVTNNTALGIGAYTLNLKLSGSGTCDVWFYNATQGALFTQVTLTDTPTWYSFTQTLTATGSTVFFGRRIGGTATCTSVTFGGAQVELGTVANPYVATGATVASSSYGAYYEEFDGVGTRQTLSSVPFQMSDDFFIVAGFNTTLGAGVSRNVIAWQWIGGGGARLQLNMSPTGSIDFNCRNDASTVFDVTSGGNYSGQDIVASVQKIYDTIKLRINGVVVSTITNAGLIAPVATFGGVYVGCNGSTVTAQNFLIGKKYALEFGKGAITDSQLLTIERYVGQKTGVTI